MIREILARNDFVPRRGTDLGEVILMLNNEAVAGTVQFHGQEYRS
jgi:hypothetical protein